MPVATVLSLALTLAPPIEEPPGGYWGTHERRPPEPRDGRQELFVGGFMLPIGLLRVGLGAAMVWQASPANCAGLEDRYGIKSSDCPTVYTYGWYGIGIGSLSAITGIVMLAIGGSRAAKHRRWKRGELGVMPTPGGFAMQLAWRF